MKFFFRIIALFVFLLSPTVNVSWAGSREGNKDNEARSDSLLLLYDENAELADSVIPLLKKNIDLLSPSQKTGYFKRIARYYYAKEVPDSAFLYFNRGALNAQKIKDKYHEAYFRLWTGIIMNIKSDYISALDQLKEARSLGMETDSSMLLSRITRNTGNVYWGMGNYEKALENYFQSLRICEAHNFTQGIASAYNNIGNVYQSVNDTDKALDYYQRSHRLSNENNFKWVAAITANNIGDLLLINGNYDSAIIYFNESLKILEELGSKMHKGVSLFNIAEIYLKKDSTEKARKYLDESLLNAEEAGDRLGIANCYLKLAESYLLEKHPDMAVVFLDSGMNVAREIGSFSLLEFAHQLKANYYTLNGNFPDAYKMMEKRIALKDSLFSRESGQNIAKLESRIKEEQRIHEIESLEKKRTSARRFYLVLLSALLIIVVLIYFNLRNSRRNNLILSRQNKEIEKQRIQLERKNKELIQSQNELRKINEGKDQFMTIISHDLRNPVSAIRGFVELMIVRFEDLNPEDQKRFLQEIFDSVEKISLLINNILFWVRSQTTGFNIKNEKFNIHKRIKDNISIYNIIARSKNIRLLNNVPEGLEIISDKNILDTVLRNLISNSLKFTNEGGRIHFFAEQMNGHVILTIKDNGVGINEEKLKDILSQNIHYTTSGTRHEQGTGLGLSLSKEFVHILRGQFHIKSREGKGSEFIINLPATPE